MTTPTPEQRAAFEAAMLQLDPLHHIGRWGEGYADRFVNAAWLGYCAALAEVEALRADAERMDWLEQNRYWTCDSLTRIHPTNGPVVLWRMSNEDGRWGDEHKTMRAAIDAARAALAKGDAA